MPPTPSPLPVQQTRRYLDQRHRLVFALRAWLSCRESLVRGASPEAPPERVAVLLQSTREAEAELRHVLLGLALDDGVETQTV